VNSISRPAEGIRQRPNGDHSPKLRIVHLAAILRSRKMDVQMYGPDGPGLSGASPRKAQQQTILCLSR
jgi:hypothetical protein